LGIQVIQKNGKQYTALVVVSTGPAMTRQHSANSKQCLIRVPNPEIHAENAEGNMAYTRVRGELEYQNINESRETNGAN
jgi:hypothetical protein